MRLEIEEDRFALDYLVDRIAIGCLSHAGKVVGLNHGLNLVFNFDLLLQPLLSSARKDAGGE